MVTMLACVTRQRKRRVWVDPVGHVAAEAAAHGHHARGIDVVPLRQRIGDGHQVAIALVAPDVAPDALDEVVAEAG
jgi:hypothetical protein